MDEKSALKQNIQSHNSIHDKYENIHGEIFNPLEQERLHQTLVKAGGYIQSSSGIKEALDFGCGSGNLTRHLLDLGFRVTASDLADKFLSLVTSKYGQTGKLNTLQLNGIDLSNIQNNRFDFVATYSVLHHIPDYLSIISEMVRVTKPGGVIFIDHENNDSFWKRTPEYIEFLKRAEEKPVKNTLRFFTPPYYWRAINNYVLQFRLYLNPRFQPEGDIHVWPDDHIDWKSIEALLIKHGCNIILTQDYLHFKRDYPPDIYQLYRDKCSDMRVLIANKH